jgi:hypothetical protein
MPNWNQPYSKSKGLVTRAVANETSNPQCYLIVDYDRRLKYEKVHGMSSFTMSEGLLRFGWS